MPVRKIIRSTGHALKGFRKAYSQDLSVRLEIWLGLPIFAIVLWVLWPLSVLELVSVIFAYGIILMAEFFNTSIEFLLDKLHPSQDEAIGAAKDIAAMAMLWAFIVAGLVVLVLLLNNYELVTL